ncbi:MAG: CPBP family intramembrane metalloprotease [Acidobacteriia bacterium]|nr:CPBP family intramembrane metalloprotease [Terriglobia bacterium]
MSQWLDLAWRPGNDKNLGMPSDGSKLPEQVPPAVEAEAPLASDDRLAAELRGFGPLGIVAMLAILLTGNFFVRGVIVPVGAALALAWIRLSRTPWQEVGYVRPKNWIGTVAVGIVFGIAFKFLMKAIVMPLLGADAINRAYHHWAGNTAAMPAAVWAMLVAGFAEETVFRGYFFERLGKLFGPGLGAKAAIVLITSASFGLAHYAVQGLAGAEHAAIVGLVLGAIFAFTGRIFLLMIAHAAFDLTALAIIYWSVETKVAHLIFK